MEDTFITTYNPKSTTRPKKGLIIGAIIATIVAIVIAIAIVIQNLTPSQPDVVKVDGYSNLDTYLPPITKENLSAQLYYLLSQHFDTPDNSNAITANVRSDTFEYLDSDSYDITSAKFILDVDDYQQTYSIYLSWSTDSNTPPNDVSIECTTREIAKYPDAMCYGMYTTSNSIELYLPYSTQLTTGQAVTTSFNYYTTDGTAKILISVNDCGNQDLKSAALSTIKVWLTSLDFNPDSFTYEVVSQYNNCVIR